MIKKLKKVRRVFKFETEKDAPALILAAAMAVMDAICMAMVMVYG